ncbi:MAG TPA: hypothetical protein VKA68_14275 [bacterium]|nr:hypothetical protein [bacterium]
MPHIKIQSPLPGIAGLLQDFPDTGESLSAFTEVLLRGPSPLSAGERELIAAYTSHHNDCFY